MDDGLDGVPGLGASGTDWADSPGPADGLRSQELSSRVLLTISARSGLANVPSACQLRSKFTENSETWTRMTACAGLFDANQ
jgi:hypothetical protein